jgi:hypothetical protein
MRTKNLYLITYPHHLYKGVEEILYVAGDSIIDALTTFQYCKGLIEPIEIKFISKDFIEMVVEDDTYGVQA